MDRGKIIGGLVFAAAAVLVTLWLLTGSENDATISENEAAAEAGGPAGQDVNARGAEAGTVTAAVSGDQRVYAIDPAGTEVYWRIYRSGVAARFGHNHVISVSAIDGSVTLGSDLAAAQWQLSFPVDALVIDDPELRARYGEDFESVPSDEDKAGTKENMLTDAVLDGANFPQIRLAGRGVVGSLDNASLPVTITMLGRSIEQAFPASISVAGDTLTVMGEYRLTHTDLGMEPFSIFGGAMAVGENIDFTYSLRAVAVGQ